MATTIVTKNGSGAPTASDLVAGELAVDLTNKRLYTEDSGGTVLELGTNPASDVTFGDNTKAIFGAGDLQIYHDGSHSYISDQGTGDLRILAADFRIRNAADNETMIQANSDADVSLWYNNSKKLATTNTGIDVTGTVTADGLTVDGQGKIQGSFALLDLVETDITDKNTRVITSGGQFRVDTVNDALSSSTKRIMVDHTTGDISFYEDTGTTAKLFWDASAESLGIGTTSPTGLLHLAADNAHVISKVMASTTGYDAELWLGRNDTRKAIIKAEQLSANSDHDLVFFTNAASADATEKVRITSAGNVGIGTDSPDTSLHISEPSTATARVRLEQTDTTLAADQAVGVIEFEQNDAAGAGVPAKFGAFAEDPNAAVGLRFYTGTGATANERMRLDSSGNLLVGTTSASIYNDTSGNGIQLNGGAGQIVVAKQSSSASDPALWLNNTGVDGSIVTFAKDGTTVGSIGSRSAGANLYVAFRTETTGDGCGLTGSSASDGAIIPSDGNGAAIDNHIDLGASSTRFDDIYATNGTIQTSDRNEKQDIEALSEAEQRVAVAAKGLLRKFRWKSSVEENGDEARTHFGIIAQDLQAAFAAEGLDAGDYAMFINSTWTDEETGEERSRMGVRYSELLAFIIAAI